MKKEFPHKAGDIITIYADWENELDPIGTAKLVELHSLGRSFILEDTYPESEQIVYNYQEWKIGEINPISKEIEHDETHPLFLHFWFHPVTYKVRYIDTIGIANSTEDVEEDDELTYLRLSKDKFLSINDKEIY
ncbi:hypothetical protein [Mesotoga prima]|uniref:hypothetical protein n=1 Tax=Mesotoga prima TaxID=1184387 RepID=UPI001E079CDA|nr:hypothetical protein [Bdellovibrionales bacterium]